jgi:hypothetical protein
MSQMSFSARQPPGRAGRESSATSRGKLPGALGEVRETILDEILGEGRASTSNNIP